jgi:SSS family solute:Na+ symporter
VVSVFLPFFFNSGVASIYDYLERRFGKKTRSVMSGIFLFGNIAYSGIMLYTTALVLQFLTGIGVVEAIILVAAFVVAYTAMGGNEAVIWVDVFQTSILFIGAGIVLYMLVAEAPGGFLATLAELKAEGMTEPFKYTMDPSVEATIWTGVVAMSIYHIVVYGVNQMMVQRTLAAKSVGDAKKSYIFMGYVATSIFVLFFLIGILLYQHFGGREFTNGNLIMLEYVAELEIAGLMGILTAAVVAASMSALASSLNSMATVTTVDFYQKYLRKDMTDAHYLGASRFFTFAWGVLIVLPALLFMNSDGSVLQTLSKVGSFFVGAKLAAYGLGFYSRHTTERGLLVGIVAGFLCLWFVAETSDIAWPWYCAIGGVVSVSVAWLASVLLDGFQAEYHPYTVQGQRETFRRDNRPEKVDGWYVLPGKVDRSSYLLLVFFVLTMLTLWGLQAAI